MQVTIHSIDFKAAAKLEGFIESRIQKLAQFHDSILDAEVFLKLEKNNEIGNKVTEIKLNIPGKDLFACKQCRTFEEATDETVEALRRQLRKDKGKKTMA